MGSMTRAFILIAMVACLTSVAHAIAGQATFYTPPYTPSSCYGNQDQGVPQPCTGNSVDVTVVDLCPGCASNQVDLSQEAFAVIANRDAGRINIEYNRI
ncbi:EG45-like domain containing protein [Tanacetum coccineum]